MALEEELADAATWEDAHKGKRKYKVLASIADFMEGGEQLGFFPGRRKRARLQEPWRLVMFCLAPLRPQADPSPPPLLELL